MKSNLAKLRIDRLIVHEIPARLVSGDGPPPVLSEVESRLDQMLRNYFGERIKESLAAAAYDVVLDADSASPVPGLVLDHLNGTGKPFVAMSQDMAGHLYASQTGVNPDGLLTVAHVSIADRRGLGILKLDKEEGLRVKSIKLENKRTFNIEHIRELMLTNRTRVFKAALFVQRGKTLASVEAIVSDKQRGYQPKTEVADFFLKRFLGCALREAPDVTTKRFFQATDLFVNTRVSDPVLKTQYQMALLTEMNSGRPTIEPKRFAENNLQPPDRDSYAQLLVEQGITVPVIDKDTTLIKNQIKRVQLELESGILVLGTPENFEAHVTMTNVESGSTRIEIEDRIAAVHTKR